MGPGGRGNPEYNCNFPDSPENHNYFEMEMVSFGAPELGLSNDDIFKVLDDHGDVVQSWSKMFANHVFFLTSPLFCKDLKHFFEFCL